MKPLLLCIAFVIPAQVRGEDKNLPELVKHAPAIVRNVSPGLTLLLKVADKATTVRVSIATTTSEPVQEDIQLMVSYLLRCDGERREFNLTPKIRYFASKEIPETYFKVKVECDCRVNYIMTLKDIQVVQNVDDPKVIDVILPAPRLMAEIPNDPKEKFEHKRGKLRQMNQELQNQFHRDCLEQIKGAAIERFKNLHLSSRQDELKASVARDLQAIFPKKKVVDR